MSKSSAAATAPAAHLTYDLPMSNASHDLETSGWTMAQQSLQQPLSMAEEEDITAVDVQSLVYELSSGQFVRRMYETEDDRFMLYPSVSAGAGETSGCWTCIRTSTSSRGGRPLPQPRLRPRPLLPPSPSHPASPSPPSYLNLGRSSTPVAKVIDSGQSCRLHDKNKNKSDPKVRLRASFPPAP